MATYRERYNYDVIEGKPPFGLTEIKMVRVDIDDFSDDEVDDVLEDLRLAFPPAQYRLHSKLNPFKDVLTIYINFTKAGRELKRGPAGVRTVVPRADAIRRLKSAPPPVMEQQVARAR